MNQNQKSENTATITTEPREDWLLKISGWHPVDVLDLEKITPKRLSWQIYLPWEEKREVPRLVLPERLTNSQYGSIELEANLRKLAEQAPGIKKIWKITEKLPSLTDLISEERDNE